MDINMTTDARTRYTKMVIHSAFLQLLKERPIEKVSVAEICRLAGINRATFYRNYENQYDLLSALENEMLEDIKKSVYQYDGNIDKLTETILEKFSEQKEMWTLLLSDHADLGFLLKIYSFLEDHLTRNHSTKESELRYRFLLHGYSGVFDDWIKGGMKEPPRIIAGYLSKFRHDLTDHL